MLKCSLGWPLYRKKNFNCVECGQYKIAVIKIFDFQNIWIFDFQSKPVVQWSLWSAHLTEVLLKCYFAK